MLIKPMLCKDDVDRFLKTHDPDRIIYEPKLDGVRCLAVVTHGEVHYWSRNGKEFKNFSVFDPYFTILRHLVGSQVAIFDGEVTAASGDFSETMTQVHRLENVDTSKFVFNIFDIINPKPLCERKALLNDIFLFVDTTTVQLVPYHKLNPGANVGNLTAFAVDTYKWEGIILKDLDSHYEYKKSGHWCKSKPFSTLDLRVTGKLIGTGKYKDCLGKLVCEYQGVEVKVGSGFTDAQRIEFWNNPPDIIEVKYQEITKAGSLRFPTFIRVREDKDEVD